MTGPATPPLRVLEIAQGVAGPLCCRLFAGFGHDVLKCEPPGGDRQRAAEPAAADGTAFSFTALNEAKRGLVADLADAASRARVEELADAADVMICDLPPARAVLLDVTPRQLIALAGDRQVSDPQQAIGGLAHGGNHDDGLPIKPRLDDCGNTLDSFC